MWSKVTIICFLFSLYSCLSNNELMFRIWRGKPIQIEQAPHSISINVNGAFRCGGTILTEDVVLTAAHCFRKMTNGGVEIRAGSTSRKTGGISVGMRDYLIHPYFDPETLQNDIALLWLTKRLPFSSRIQPVPDLAAQGEPDLPTGTLTFDAGWGLMEDNLYPNMIRGVELPIFHHKRCKQIWAESAQIEITPRMICAGYTQGGKDTCKGDSGSGLLAGGRLIGISVFGSSPCGEPNTPGVYTKVASYRKWIDDSIRNNKIRIST